MNEPEFFQDRTWAANSRPPSHATRSHALNSEPDSNVRLLTVAQAAEFLGCRVTNVYGLLRTGRLPFVRIGQRKGYRIDRRDLEQFVDSRKERRIAIETTPSWKPRVALKHIRLN